MVDLHPASDQDTPVTLAGDEVPMDLDRMMASAREASDFLKAVAHESRLLLLCLLGDGERSVSELEQSLQLRQPTVSQQLARLRLDGLVKTRRDGKTVYYSLADEGIRKFIGVLYARFCCGKSPDSGHTNV